MVSHGFRGGANGFRPFTASPNLHSMNEADLAQALPSLRMARMVYLARFKEATHLGWGKRRDSLLLVSQGRHFKNASSSPRSFSLENRLYGFCHPLPARGASTKLACVCFRALVLVSGLWRGPPVSRSTLCGLLAQGQPWPEGSPLLSLRRFVSAASFLVFGGLLLGTGGALFTCLWQFPFSRASDL